MGAASRAELLTTVEFNGKLERRRWLRREPADGLGSSTKTGAGRTGRSQPDEPLCTHPARAESMHVLVMGDTGQQERDRSAGVVSDRGAGETAIVYDPAMEYCRSLRTGAGRRDPESS